MTASRRLGGMCATAALVGAIAVQGRASLFRPWAPKLQRRAAGLAHSRAAREARERS